LRTESIRVAHVLEATVGGTKRHLCDLTLGLYPRRFQQRFQQRFRQHAFLSRERDSASADEMVARLRAGGIEVSVIPMTRGLSPVADWRALRKLEAALRAWQPDIIHGHSSKAGFLARVVRSPAKRVYTPHGFAFQMQPEGLRNRLYEALERWAGRRTDALIALCESEKRLAVERGIVVEERVRVIENGVDVCLTPRPPLPASLRAAWGEGEHGCLSPGPLPGREGVNGPEDGPVIGTVGALTEQKDTRTLIRALPLVRREYPEATVVVAGEGHLHAQLAGEAQRLGLGDAVRLLGQRDDVPELLTTLDVFVLPSLWEGLPYALLEAMAAEVPCVGSGVPGITDLIADGQTGLLFPPGEAGALAAAVVALLREPARAREYAQAAAERVRSHNTIAHMVAQTAALYEELCEV
jgi:glycosyltransferase involved in cell wall biosynthesis